MKFKKFHNLKNYYNYLKELQTKRQGDFFKKKKKKIKYSLSFKKINKFHFQKYSFTSTILIHKVILFYPTSKTHLITFLIFLTIQ